jgi:hypothetical protein
VEYKWLGKICLREASHHCEAHHLHEVQHRSFVSACGGMMLTFGQMMLRASTQMMLCPADTNEKILKAELSGFFESS